jgi:transposase
MEAYSLDLRQRIVQACDEAINTRPEIAQSFSVSLSFVNKLWRRWIETGSAAARPKGKGPPPVLDSPKLEQLRQCVEHKPDSTLSELCDALAKAGGPGVSRSTMCRALRTLDLPLKKSPCMPVNVTRRA